MERISIARLVVATAPAALSRSNGLTALKRLLVHLFIVVNDGGEDGAQLCVGQGKAPTKLRK